MELEIVRSIWMLADEGLLDEKQREREKKNTERTDQIALKHAQHSNGSRILLLELFHSAFCRSIRIMEYNVVPRQLFYRASVVLLSFYRLLAVLCRCHSSASSSANFLIRLYRFLLHLPESDEPSARLQSHEWKVSNRMQWAGNFLKRFH